MTAPSLLDQANAALKAGDTISARNLLTQALKADPNDAQLWLALSACWDEPEKKRFCLEKALALQPDDPQIRQLITELPAASGETASPAPPGQPEELQTDVSAPG